MDLGGVETAMASLLVVGDCSEDPICFASCLQVGSNSALKQSWAGSLAGGAAVCHSSEHCHAFGGCHGCADSAGSGHAYLVAC